MAEECVFRLGSAGVVLDGVRVLRDVTLCVEPGEPVALVGPSGAGKTTLLRLLNGTQRPASGSVAVEGHDLAALSPGALRKVRARVGFVHQEHALVPNLRVVQNVVAGRLGQRSLFGGVRAMLWPSREELERVHALLERLGIEARLFARTDSLSGGERQRVAIARALYQEPAALVLDEPVASVDPVRARALIDQVLDLARADGLALVVSLHDLELARECFPRVVGLRDGALVFDDAPGRIGGSAGEVLFRIGSEADALDA